MKKSIWKFAIEPKSKQELLLPLGSEILCVQMQGNYANNSKHPFIWALVDPEETEKESVIIEQFGTGHRIDFNNVHRRYIGTYQMDNGELIFHVFERL